MNDSSNPPFIAPLKAVDPTTRLVLRQVDQAAKVLDLRYFVAGAMARDLVLVNAFGFAPGRATRDIDFGIAVERWQQFEALKLKLIEGGEFNTASHSAQRLYWKGLDAAGNTPVDIVPFGRIASTDKKIAWPPHRDIVMNVAGFEEALECATRLQIDDGLVVSVASLAGLTVLKLIAWQDRGLADNRDAKERRWRQCSRVATASHSRPSRTRSTRLSTSCSAWRSPGT
jgi:predicted nucleotidyltransferase